MNKKYYVVYSKLENEMQYGTEMIRDEVFKLRKNKNYNIMSVKESSNVK